MTSIPISFHKKHYSHISKLDFYSILFFVNRILLLANIFAYFYFGENQYINFCSLALISLIHLQIILLEPIHRNNIFSFLMIFIFLLFYSSRISTLLYDPTSIMVQFQKNAMDATEINYFLIFINSYFVVFSLFIYNSVEDNSKLNLIKESNAKNDVIFYISGLTLYLSLFFTFFALFNPTYFIEYKYINYLFIILDYRLLLIFLFVSFFINISTKKIYFLFLLIPIFIYLISLSGSRGAIFSLIIIAFISSLVVYKSIRITKSIILVLLTLFITSIWTFQFATFTRSYFISYQLPYTIQNLFYVQKTYFLGDNILLTTSTQNTQNIFNRLGYLDMGAFVFNYNKSNLVYTPKNYYLSVVNHSLTPGFDPYNTLPTSRLLRGQYESLSIHQLKQSYHTDIATIFAELYVLASWGGLIIFFFILKGIHSLKNLIDTSRQNLIIKYTFLSILYLYFFDLLNSFGIDTLVISAIKLLLPALLFTFIIRKGLV